MDIMSRHTIQVKDDPLYKLKAEAFFRILDQVEHIHTDDAIPPALKNISLYLEHRMDAKGLPYTAKQAEEGRREPGRRQYMGGLLACNRINNI